MSGVRIEAKTRAIGNYKITLAMEKRKTMVMIIPSPFAGRK